MRIFPGSFRYLVLLSSFVSAVAVSRAIVRAEQRVKATVTGPAAAVGGKAFDLLVSLEVEEGYHIQSNAAKDPYIPTSVIVTAPAGYKVGPAAYPAPKTEEFFGEKIRVFDGKITVKVPVTPPANAKGKQELYIKVGYQACNEKLCDPPTSVNVTGEVTVSPGTAKPPAGKPAPKKAKHK
jgi:DsbC/DsbD-like thiol-disulfide interchange protein